MLHDSPLLYVTQSKQRIAVYPKTEVTSLCLQVVHNIKHFSAARIVGRTLAYY